MFPIVVLIAQLAAAPGPVQHAYQKLTAQELQAKKTAKKPPKGAQRIDVSAKIRSVSFGHKTWLWVGKGGKEFWVEYGRSTNTPAGLFGPFTVDEAAAPPSGSAAAPTSPPPQDPKLR